MTKLEKAEAKVVKAQAHYGGHLRAAREARKRLAATPEGKAFLTLRKATHRAKYALLEAREKYLRAEAEEKHAETVYPWTRFKASDSPYRMGD
jgi:hypothetical protein